MNLKDGGVDADGNACCDAQITYVYECEYNGVTYETSGNMSPAVGSGEWVKDLWDRYDQREFLSFLLSVV